MGRRTDLTASRDLDLQQDQPPHHHLETLTTYKTKILDSSSRIGNKPDHSNFLSNSSNPSKNRDSPNNSNHRDNPSNNSNSNHRDSLSNNSNNSNHRDSLSNSSNSNHRDSLSNNFNSNHRDSPNNSNHRDNPHPLRLHPISSLVFLSKSSKELTEKNN